jgi:ABC-type uncharacterized transport system involved in gliding motility auxiliary subunit
MKSGRTVLIVALLLAGLVAVNYLASALPVRLDATAGKIYTLSPGTKAILEKLEEPVRLDFYFSASATGLRVSDKNYAARVQEMLRQYVRAARGRLELTVTDPKPDTPEEEKAAAAGLTGQPLPTGETIYFGLVVTHADKQETIPFFSAQREQFLEYDLTRAIYTVQLFDRRKLGLLTSLPLRAQPDFMAMQMGRLPENQLILGEWERNFEIVAVEASATELPAGLDALAVIHPQGVSEKLQFAIDQFLLSGKPVFLALDPSSRTLADRSRQQQMMMGGPPPGTSSNLPTLLSGWGLDYNPANLVGDLENAMQVSTGAGRVSRFPHWIGLTRANLSATSLPTSQLESLMFVEAGAIALKEGAQHLTFTPLAQTSAQSGDIPALSAQFSLGDDLARQLTVSGRKTIAALVQGKFKTAFPGGRPKDAATDTKSDSHPVAAQDEKTKAEAAAALKESSGTSTLLVVADTDWLMDSYSVRRMNFLGMQAYEPLNDNLAFASNAVEFLAGSNDLISIRGKGASFRPFTVVRRMEAEAQRRYQEQLTALEARLSEVQTKLTELQGKKTEGNRLVATPEVAKAIDDFQRQQAAMRAERRQIRAALRADIELLENGLLVLNLLAPIVLVAAFGLWFRHHRRTATV